MSEPLDDQFLKDFYQSPRPEFGDALLKKLSAEPKRQPHRLHSLFSWLTMPRLTRQVAAICLLLCLILFVSPSARAQLGALMHTIGGVVFVERATYPTESEMESIKQADELWQPRILSFADAEAQLPFAIQLPSWVPERFELRDEVMVLGAEHRFALAIVTWCDMQSGECLRLNMEHAPNGSNEWLVGRESIEEIEINGSPAALVRGAWDAKQEAWELGEVITLSWHSSQEDITYHLMASEGAVPIEALVRMAESVP